MKSGWITVVFVGVIVVGGLAYVFLRGDDGPQLGQEPATPAVTETAEPAETGEPVAEDAPSETAAQETASEQAASGSGTENADAPVEPQEAADQDPGTSESQSDATESGSVAADAASSSSAAEEGAAAIDSAADASAEGAATAPETAIAPEAATADPGAAQQTATQEEAASSNAAAGGQEQLAARSDDATQTPGPSFDVVRVEQTGEAVIAGWAPPGSVVTLYNGGDALGTVTADGAGNWVLLPAAPLAAGSRELYLTAKTRSGELVESADSVVVVVPEPAPTASETAAETSVANQQTVETSGQADGEALDQGGSDTATSSVVAEAPAVPVVSGQAGNPDSAAADPVSEDVLADNVVADEAATAGASAPTAALAVLVPRQGQGASRILQEPSADEGIADQDLVLNAIDYDQAGRVVISGRAGPGTRILVYLDNELVGQTQADAQRRWVVSPNERIEPGLHSLRVDQVDDGGAVIARVETPFSRAESLTDLPGENFVIVQPGNSLWRIARKTYGDGFRFSLIYRSNEEQIRDPDLIYPGQVFLVPGPEGTPVN